MNTDLKLKLETEIKKILDSYFVSDDVWKNYTDPKVVERMVDAAANVLDTSSEAYYLIKARNDLTPKNTYTPR
jgi:hypothetical protein